MSEARPVYERLLVLLERRVEQGIKQYGTPLLPHNGRDALMDLWEELADALQYCTQLLLEREASGTPPPTADAGGAEPTGPE